MFKKFDYNQYRLSTFSRIKLFAVSGTQCITILSLLMLHSCFRSGSDCGGYSLYSESLSEDNPAAVTKDLDRCARLLGDMLSNDKGIPSEVIYFSILPIRGLRCVYA